MPSPTSPTYYTPSQKEFIYAIESVAAGTAGTVLIREPCIDIVPTINRTTAEMMGYTGNAAIHIGSDETQHNATVVVTVDARADGFAGIAMLAMLGNGADTYAAGPPKTHTKAPSITTNRCNTFTIWFNTGDSSNCLQFTYGSISDISFGVDPTGRLVATITMECFFPTKVAHPSITNYVGSTANYKITTVLGSQGTYSIRSSAGSGATYVPTANIQGATLDFSRQVEVEPNGAGLNPADIGLGELTMAVSLTAQYDGLGANTAYSDYLNYAELGDSNGGADTTHMHIITFTDANSNGFKWIFYPARWGNDFALDYSGVIVKMAGSLDLYHDPASINSGTPKQTAPYSFVLTNDIASAMVS